MNLDIDERLAKLERQNETLRGEVAALKAKDGRKVLPAPPVEPVVKISHPIAASTFAMPSDAELDSLREIVCTKYPQLGESAGLADYGAKEQDEAAWLEQFELSFLALGNMRRTEAPDRRRYASHWMEEAEIWLRSHGKRSPTLRFGPFVAAVLAHGDILFSGLSMDGHVLELGLSTYAGREARDAWKKVLEKGELLQMTPVRVPMAPPSPARVVIGDHAGR